MRAPGAYGGQEADLLTGDLTVANTFLSGGDATNDNRIDIDDLAALIEAFDADLFAALFTDAEFAGFQSLQSLLDLENQLSLAIAYS